MVKHTAKKWDKDYKKGVKWDNFPPSFTVKRFRKRLRKNNRVLDLGCGSGRDAIYLAKEGFDTYGVDFSKVAIEKAKKKYRAKNLHYVVSTIEKLPFEDEFFKGVYSGYVLNFTDMEKSSSEVHRVLKKGGLFYLVLGLKSKVVKSGKVEIITKEKDILKAVKRFRLIKKIRYEGKLDGKNVRKNNLIRLILEKN